MKRIDTNFSWLVTNFDCNKQKIEKYDVLRYKEDEIKKLKKEFPTREEFEKELRLKCMSQYWSRAEYELIITVNSKKRVLLKPWCGCRDNSYAIDVTFENDFDWKGFALKHINTKYGQEAKIDVWDQIEYKWNEFVDFVWNYHHKWQRRK